MISEEYNDHFDTSLRRPFARHHQSNGTHARGFVVATQLLHAACRFSYRINIIAACFSLATSLKASTTRTLVVRCMIKSTNYTRNASACGALLRVSHAHRRRLVSVIRTVPATLQTRTHTHTQTQLDYACRLPLATGVDACRINIVSSYAAG